MQALAAGPPARCQAHSASSCSGRAPAAAQRAAPPARHRHRCRAQVSGQHPEEGQPPEGNSGLQDSLIKQLQFEIGKKRVDEFVEEEAEGLRAKAEEGKAELDKLADLQKLRADVAFNSALADINREADEFEEQLRKSREKQEASEREQEQWEDEVAVSRSQGQFFQTLYQTNKKRPVGMSTEQLQERAEKVKEPARSEVGSTVRYYLFAFLAFVLAAEVVADLQSDAPSAAQDVLYTLLVLALAWTSISERKSMR